MSDTPQSPGWWQASDGKWYPPERRPSGAGAGWNSPRRALTDPGDRRRLFIILVVATAILAVGIVASLVTGGDTSSSYDKAAYQAALEQCKVIGLAQLYDLRPNATASNEDDMTLYAGFVNRCIADRLGVDLKYLPNDKPVFGR